MKITRTDALTGYKIDFTHNTLTMNYKFAHSALNDYGSPENLRMKDILHDFPQLRVIVKAGREVKTTNKNKRLTYDNMRKYILTFNNADELLNTFDTVINRSKPLASPYAYVSDWFRAQFPDYTQAFTAHHDLVIRPLPAPSIDGYKRKSDEFDEDAAAQLREVS